MAAPWLKYQQRGMTQQNPDDPYIIQGPVREPTPQTGAQAAKDQADAEKARAEATNAAQLAAAQAQKASAEARLAEMQAKAGNPQAQGEADTNGQRRALMDQLGNSIRTAEGKYRANYRDAGLIDKIAQHLLPDRFSPTNQSFDTVGSQMSNIAQGVTRVPGVGSQSDYEFAQFIKANQPQHTDFNQTIEDKLQGMKDRVDSYRAHLGMQPMNWDEGKAAPGEVADKTRQMVANPTAQDQVALGRGTKTIDDPVLRGIAGKLGAMVSGKVPDDQILKFLQDQGVNPADTNIGQVLGERLKPSFRKWQQMNPGKPYPIGKSFYQKEVQLSPVQNSINNAAQSAYGTGTVAAAQAFTGNRLDDAVGALGGNAAQARLGEQMLRNQHPYAAFAGDVAGQGAFDMLASQVPGLGPLLETRMGKRAGDLAYGAYAGSGENNGDRTEGGLLGAASNAIGGAIGRNVQRYGGKALKGVQDEGLQYLNDRGIPMTIGEMSRAAKDPMLRAVGGIEDRLAGLPVAGDIINNARRRGSQAFNEAAFGEGGKPIGYAPPKGLVGATANEGFAQANSQAYTEALKGVNITRDKPFDTQFQKAIDFGAKNPRHGPDFLSIVNDEIKPLFNPDGTMTGENLQAALQVVRTERAAYRGQPLGAQTQKALTQVENALTGMVRRQAPGVMPALNAANEAYTNRRVLGKAVMSAKNREDELFTPAQLNTASVGNTMKYGGPDAAQSTSRPFYNLGTAGQQFLSNVVPDSGTAGRLLIPGAIGAAAGGAAGALGGDNRAQGAGSGAGEGLALGLTLSAPYSKVGQKVIQKGFLGSRAEVTALEDLIRKNPYIAKLLLNPNVIGGHLGSAVGRQTGLYGDQLGQPYP